MIALASHIWLRCFRYAWEEPHSGTPSVHSHFEGTYFYSAVVQHPRLGWWRGPSKYPCHACLARTIGADAENRQTARVRERERWVACVRSNGKLNIGALCFSVSISYSLSAYLTFYRLLISLIRRMPMCRTEAGQRRNKNHRGRDESWKWELMLVVCVPTLMVCVCVYGRVPPRGPLPERWWYCLWKCVPIPREATSKTLVVLAWLRLRNCEKLFPLFRVQ